MCLIVVVLPLWLLLSYRLCQVAMCRWRGSCHARGMLLAKPPAAVPISPNSFLGQHARVTLARIWSKAACHSQSSAELDSDLVNSLCCGQQASMRRAACVNGSPLTDSFQLLQVGFVCCLQLVMAYVVRDMPWWKIVFAGYTVGGTANQNLLSAQHELSHFLAFKRPLYNRILSILSNCPVVVPMAVAFRKYHQEHHSHLVSLWGVIPSHTFEWWRALIVRQSALLRGLQVAAGLAQQPARESAR